VPSVAERSRSIEGQCAWHRWRVSVRKLPIWAVNKSSGDDVKRNKEFCMKRALIFIFAFVSMSLNAFTQAVDLDSALIAGSESLGKRLPKNSTIAILDFKGDSKMLSDYVVDNLTSYFINNTDASVVDRNNLALIQQEMDYQLSGEVDDDSAVSLGKQLGAQTIVTGSISPFGNAYRLNLRTLSVETAQVQGIYTQDIKLTNRLASLLRGDTVVPITEMWKYKWLYLGLRGGGSYNNKYDVASTEPIYDVHNAGTSLSVNGAFSMAAQITSWLGVQAELIYTEDTTDLKTVGGSIIETDDAILGSEGGSGTFVYKSLMIPVLGKITFRPGRFSFSGLGGVYVGIPFGEMQFDGTLQAGEWKGTFKPINTSFGIMFGGNIGFHLGPGILLFDVRYAMDLSGTKFEPIKGEWSMWNDYSADWKFMPDITISRQKTMFTVGYEIGLFNK
jgi:TolB-like protein